MTMTRQVLYDSEKEQPPNENSFKDQPQRKHYSSWWPSRKLFMTKTRRSWSRPARCHQRALRRPHGGRIRPRPPCSTGRRSTRASSSVPLPVLDRSADCAAGQYDLSCKSRQPVAVPPNTTPDNLRPGQQPGHRQVTRPPGISLAGHQHLHGDNAGGRPRGDHRPVVGTSDGTIALLTQSVPGSGLQLPQIVATYSSEYKGSFTRWRPAGIRTYTLLLTGSGQPADLK